MCCLPFFSFPELTGLFSGHPPEGQASITSKENKTPDDDRLRLSGAVPPGYTLPWPPNSEGETGIPPGD
jgi:hypothetical protein